MPKNISIPNGSKDILAGVPVVKKTIKQESHTGWSKFFAVILTGALISLGERIIYDLGKLIEKPLLYGKTTALDYEHLMDVFRTKQLFLESAFVIPVLLGAFLIYLKFGFREGVRYKIVIFSYFIFSVVMLFDLLVRTGIFLIGHTNYGIYIVLVIVVAVLTGIIMAIQKRAEFSK